MLNNPFARRNFALPGFAPAPLEFDADEELLLCALAAELGPQPERRTIEPAPTAGELHATIERHLRPVAQREEPQAEAVDALRHALAELRRSIG